MKKVYGLKINKAKIKSDLEMVLILLEIRDKNNEYKDSFEDSCRVTTYIITLKEKLMTIMGGFLGVAITSFIMQINNNKGTFLAISFFSFILVIAMAFSLDKWKPKRRNGK